MTEIHIIYIILFSAWYFSIALCNFMINVSIYASLSNISLGLKSKSPTFRKAGVSFDSYDNHRKSAIMSIFWPYLFIKSVYILASNKK